MRHSGPLQDSNILTCCHAPIPWAVMTNGSSVCRVYPDRGTVTPKGIFNLRTIRGTSIHGLPTAGIKPGTFQPGLESNMPPLMPQGVTETWYMYNFSLLLHMI